MLAQEFQICGVFCVSHLKDRTYSPTSSDSGTSTMSLNPQPSSGMNSAVGGSVIFVHWDPSGLVPTVVLKVWRTFLLIENEDNTPKFYKRYRKGRHSFYVSLAQVAKNQSHSTFEF